VNTRDCRCSSYLLLVLLALGLGLAGCRRSSPPEADSTGQSRIPLRLQTDWYPQAEHGGFYQALARGFYADAGLDVTILPGGPGARTSQRIIGGGADVGIHRSDALMVQVAEGLPFVIVAAFMQHDPQALLLHEANPINAFRELDGQRIMAMPGTNWIAYLQRRYGIEFHIQPMNFSLAQFLADPSFIQQCFVTSEPFHALQNGARPKTLLIAESGFDPYRVIFTTQRFLRDNPDAMRTFVAASIRGWHDFMTGDPTPAKQLIAERNPQMSEAQMDYSIAAMRHHRLVHGHASAGERLGLLTRERVQSQQQTLLELGVLRTPLALEQLIRFDLLPNELPAADD
jgi:NitT/TauT family transport system substrate-binding protein